MPGIDRSHNEYSETRSESMQAEIDAAINHAKSDLNDLKSEILWWDKKPDFKTPDCINNFYRLEWSKIIFQLDQVKKYLSEVHKRLQWMKNQKFWEISKENNFTWTILAIQIALKAFETDPLKPRKYNIGKINWEYNEITKDAIRQFQTNFNLQWKDGKPGKETIWAILSNLDTLISNKKTYKESMEKDQEKLRDDVMSIVNESIALNSIWILPNDNTTKEAITNYILEWNLCTNKDKDLENKIKMISNSPLNRKLKYLMEHHWEPLTECIKKIKEQEIKYRDRIRNIYNINTDQTKNIQTNFEQGRIRGWSDKYTFWHNLTESQKGTITNVLSGWKSPVTAEMVADSCQTSKNVPVEYLLAFMQNDSRVWTVWRWARTHNPGNVWNTNRWTKDWWTWERGVDACAENLQKRIDAYLDAKVQHGGRWFNDFPTPEELATWKAKWWFRFFWIYMSAPSGPKKVAGMVKTWVNRLKWN